MRLPGIVATFRLEATTIKTQPLNAARRPASTAQDNCRPPGRAGLPFRLFAAP